ncbi:hypothetical protein [Mycolicibacter sinensis]|uniref:Uncharacterized protein n=1 Tax=Mycolicibacter sinensis (strain JDM601) TaxID=875328 RepID=A0A1A2XTG9_MYCSD|nr:hypothetical protein [Mycolicibacter sinensis]OBI29045.1 hypothetical protein A5710_22595 [Mycolicibacter sinensis]
MSKFAIDRVETITYAADLTRPDVLALLRRYATDRDLPIDAYPDAELVDTLAEAITDDTTIFDALIELTEPNGDVQGSTFKVSLIP